VRNDAVATPLRALSDAERAVLRLVRSGASNKQIAMDLSISEPTVSRLLQRAVRKLGLPGATELAHFPWEGPDTSFMPYHLGPDELLRIGMPIRDVDRLASLTKSERDVLADLLRGHSNRVISVRRDRSPKTGANQVASVFAKLRVHSRRELALVLSSGVTSHAEN
jgi:DNA-binding NarL/FixJ family response regulator